MKLRGVVEDLDGAVEVVPLEDLRVVAAHRMQQLCPLRLERDLDVLVSRSELVGPLELDQRAEVGLERAALPRELRLEQLFARLEDRRRQPGTPRDRRRLPSLHEEGQVGATRTVDVGPRAVSE